jgi:alpha-1,3-rhamnosyltransferase
VRENRGLCATLNQALELGDGDHFAYLGSDDIWLPEFLSARSALLDERTDCVLAFGNCRLIDEAGEVIGCTADNGETQAAYTQAAPADMLLSGTAPISPTVMYRCSALEKEGWNSEARLEDYELYLKLSSIGNFAFDPVVRSAWRVHGHNTSRDRAMMLREQLDAQSRNARRMGLSDQRIASARAATTFRYARIALQDGDRREALRLGRTSWRGASSAAEIARFAARLLLPELVKNLFRPPVKNI